MDGRALGPILAMGLVLGTLACGPAQRPGVPPQHVLLVSIENLRADRLSCYQHLAPTSAFASTLEERLDGRAFGLDELARAGVLFEHAFSSSSAAEPSLCALLTGRSPLETGTIEPGSTLGAPARTLAHELAAQGFACAAVVSTTRPGMVQRVALGFDTQLELEDDEAACSAALQWLERDVGAGQPTFLWLHLSGLALPWDPPLAALEPYDLRLRATLERLRAFLGAAYDWTTSPVEASETWERTLFVLCGSNGLELGEHGALGPLLSPHEEALRVPLILRHPDSITGERVLAQLVTLEDVLPTVLEAFGAAARAEVDGRSLFGALDRRPQTRFEARPAVAVLPGPTYSVRGERWRVVWRRWESGGGELSAFDHAADPLEREDRGRDAPSALSWGMGAIESWRFERAAYRPGQP